MRISLGTGHVAAPVQRGRPLLRMLLLAAAYLAGGLISIVSGMIADGPSGLSAVVWLPPGIALAALMLGGTQLWPGVLLGALCADWAMARRESPDESVATIALIAGCIALASAWQAVLGCWLVRRFGGRELTLDRPRSVLSFLWCSAVAALITPTVGLGLLIALGLRRVEDLSFDWPSWWVSDTVSAFLITPVILAWAAPSARVWRARRVGLTLPLGITLVLAAAAFSAANRLEIARASSDFQREADGVAAALQAELEDAMHGVHAIRDLAEVGGAPDSAQLTALLRRQRERHIGIDSLGWAPHVSAAQRSEHERQARAAGDASYEIREAGADRAAQRAGERADYFPLRVAAADGGKPIWGLDLAAEPARRALLERSVRERVMLMSEPLPQLPYGRAGAGLMLVLPVHSGAALLGFVTCALSVESLIEGLQDAETVLELRIEDVTDLDRPLMISQNLRSDHAPYGWQRELLVGGRSWRLHAQPTPAYLRAHRSWLPAAVSAVGLIFASLMSGFLLVTTGHAANIQQLVDQRTSQLSQSNSQLREELGIHEQMEHALKASEARWQFALEEAGEGLWEWSTPGESVYCSPRLKALLGYAGGSLEVTTASWTSLLHPRDRRAARCRLERHLRGDSSVCVVEARLRHRDGSWIWLQSRAKVVARGAHGKPLRVIGTQTDVSERKRGEQELKAHREHLEQLVRERTTELEASKAVAETANRAKSAFLANMSHELRTPMHAVLAFARLGLERPRAEPKVRDYFQRIVESGERLLRLLDDLLDLSKLEAGKMIVEIAPYDVRRIVENVREEMEPLFAGKRLSLELEQASGCESTMAPVDPTRMAQVVHNILSNAVRFSPEGGCVRVRFAAGELRAKSGRRRALELTFSDEGVGIPEAELEAIFDKFVQSSITRTNAGGSGLGLAICRQIMDLHHGAIRAQNNQLRGATFVVSLPLEADASHHTEAAA